MSLLAAPMEALVVVGLVLLKLHDHAQMRAQARALGKRQSNAGWKSTQRIDATEDTCH